MLDLEARVHLEEGGLAAIVDEELAGAGADVADRAREGQGRLAQPCGGGLARPPATASPRAPSGGGAGSSSRARRGGRPMPWASNRTWISTWRAPSTSRSRMSRSSPKAAVASRRAAARASGEPVRLADDPHPLAAAAGRRLDQERVADPRRRPPRAPRRTGRRRRSPAMTGTPSDAASRRAAALSPIARIAAGGGPTQRIPAASTASAKSAFSARNPKPGWTASAPAARAARDDRLDVEQVERARAVGPGHDGADPEPVAGPRDPRRDLAAVGDEQGADRAHGWRDRRRVVRHGRRRLGLARP